VPKNTDIKNIFCITPISPGSEVSEILYGSNNIRIERIISNLSPSPKGFWYDQNEDEWVLILEGRAQLDIEGKKEKLKKGDWILIKKHEKHRVESTSKKCLWLCVFVK
jgi:cupin 2 domain-containing protein